MKQKSRKVEKYYKETIGNETVFYSLDDKEFDKERYDINPNEIVDETQLSRLISEESAKGKRCLVGALLSSNNILRAEKRLGSNIRSLQIDTDIESVLEKLINMTYKERKKFAEKYKTANHEGCEVVSAITDYVKEKQKITVTISSVALLSKAVGSHTEAIAVIRNLRRKDIYIYFKDDGLWTGKLIHDMDIGSLAVLALCDKE